jgi:hypothetical protein
MVGFDASFDNMQDWKGTREKAGEVNGKNNEDFPMILNASYFKTKFRSSLEKKIK